MKNVSIPIQYFQSSVFFERFHLLLNRQHRICHIRSCLHCKCRRSLRPNDCQPVVNFTYILHSYVHRLFGSFFLRMYVRMYVKSCRKNICTKNSRIYCWWNWHLKSISLRFYEQLLRQYFFTKKLHTLTVDT